MEWVSMSELLVSGQKVNARTFTLKKEVTKKEISCNIEIDNYTTESIADGVILPSGQVAIEWLDKDRTLNIYPSFDDFKTIQSKQEGRSICFGLYAPDSYHLTTFTLVRNEDVTGVSGTGIVAYGCHFHHGAVLQWAGDIQSISYYPQGLSQIEKLHGHQGKTIVKLDINPSW